MNLKNLLKWRGKRSSVATPEKWLVEYFSGGSEALAGRLVNENTAMQYVAVFACVRILADTVGTLPLFLYRRGKNGGKERATDHPPYNILHAAPNRYMSAARMRGALQGHLATWGNAYQLIDYNRRTGQVAALSPLRPDRIRPKKDRKGRKRGQQCR